VIWGTEGPEFKSRQPDKQEPQPWRSGTWVSGMGQTWRPNPSGQGLHRGGRRAGL